MARPRVTKRVSANSVTVQIKPKTEEMAAYLEAAYGFGLEHAETVIAERKTNPAAWPLDHFEKCQAFVAAYSEAPRAVSTRKPWQINGRRPE